MSRAMVILAGCLATAACASTVATTVGFPAADADDDDVLTNVEFREFFDDSNAFQRYDDNDDGNLTRTEYNEAVDDTYETDAHFGGLDTDKNGSLTATEFMDGWFKLFDTDHSGTLARGEFDNAIEALEVEL